MAIFSPRSNKTMKKLTSIIILTAYLFTQAPLQISEPFANSRFVTGQGPLGKMGTVPTQNIFLHLKGLSPFFLCESEQRNLETSNLRSEQADNTAVSRAIGDELAAAVGAGLPARDASDVRAAISRAPTAAAETALQDAAAAQAAANAAVFKAEDFEPIMTLDKGSFAEQTIKQRKPMLIQNAIADNGYPPKIADKLWAFEQEIAIGEISGITEDAPDKDFWNEQVALLEGKTWLEIPWLFAEVYFYRRLLEAIGYYQSGSPYYMKDPFEVKKRLELETEKGAIALYINECQRLEQAGEFTKEQLLKNLMANSLWGNRVDLSNIAVTEDARKGLAQEEAGLNLVTDHSQDIVNMFMSGRISRFDLVCDNFGHEFICDMHLVDYLLRKGLVTSVHLHLKSSPFFVSDVMVKDWDILIERLLQDDSVIAREFGARLQKYYDSGQLVVHGEPFWSQGLTYDRMPQELVDSFKESDLAMFKGDVNYRRLLLDLKIPPTTNMEDVIASYPYTLPCPIVALRTLKSGIVADLDDGQAEAIAEEDSRWLLNGKRGIIRLVRVAATGGTAIMQGSDWNTGDGSGANLGPVPASNLDLSHSVSGKAIGDEGDDKLLTELMKTFDLGKYRSLLSRPKKDHLARLWKKADKALKENGPDADLNPIWAEAEKDGLAPVYILMAILQSSVSCQKSKEGAICQLTAMDKELAKRYIDYLYDKCILKLVSGLDRYLPVRNDSNFADVRKTLAAIEGEKGLENALMHILVSEELKVSTEGRLLAAEELKNIGSVSAFEKLARALLNQRLPEKIRRYVLGCFLEIVPHSEKNELLSKMGAPPATPEELSGFLQAAEKCLAIVKICNMTSCQRTALVLEKAFDAFTAIHKRPPTKRELQQAVNGLLPKKAQVLDNIFGRVVPETTMQRINRARRKQRLPAITTISKIAAETMDFERLEERAEGYSPATDVEEPANAGAAAADAASNPMESASASGKNAIPPEAYEKVGFLGTTILKDLSRKVVLQRAEPLIDNLMKIDYRIIPMGTLANIVRGLQEELAAFRKRYFRSEFYFAADLGALVCRERHNLYLDRAFGEAMEDLQIYVNRITKGMDADRGTNSKDVWEIVVPLALLWAQIRHQQARKPVPCLSDEESLIEKTAGTMGELEIYLVEFFLHTDKKKGRLKRVIKETSEWLVKWQEKNNMPPDRGATKSFFRLLRDIANGPQYFDFDENFGEFTPWGIRKVMHLIIRTDACFAQIEPQEEPESLFAQQPTPRLKKAITLSQLARILHRPKREEGQGTISLPQLESAGGQQNGETVSSFSTREQAAANAAANDLFEPEQFDHGSWSYERRRFKKLPFSWAMTKKLRLAKYIPISNIPYWEEIEAVLQGVDRDFQMHNQGFDMCWDWAREVLSRATYIKRLKTRDFLPLWFEEIKSMRTQDDRHSWIAVKIKGVWYALDRTAGQFKIFENYPGGIYGSLEDIKGLFPGAFYNDRDSVEITYSPDSPYSVWAQPYAPSKHLERMRQRVRVAERRRCPSSTKRGSSAPAAAGGGTNRQGATAGAPTSATIAIANLIVGIKEKRSGRRAFAIVAGGQETQRTELANWLRGGGFDGVDEAVTTDDEEIQKVKQGLGADEKDFTLIVRLGANNIHLSCEGLLGIDDNRLMPVASYKDVHTAIYVYLESI